MRGYVPNKLWGDLEPTNPKALWVATKVLALPPELIEAHRRNLPSLIYQVFFGLGATDNKYVTAFNGARVDLIASLIPPVDDNERAITIASSPEGDISHWLCTHVLLFSDIEISVLCNIGVDYLEDPGRDLLPLVKSCYTTLKKIKLQDPVLQRWHRQRHLMIRYYLDAVYHEL